MNNSKDLLLSCSYDKDCRLWSISHENCLKIFKGHSSLICLMQILSEKVFVSTSAENSVLEKILEFRPPIPT